RWYVASQINNDYFLVERSQNLLDWEVIDEVDGYGTTNQLIRYTATDAQPLLGETYYRIRQIDFDGKFDYSKIISINYTGTDDFIALFPNPLESDILNIRLEGLVGMINLEIYDNRGVLVKTENFESFGNLTYRIETSTLANGIYFLSMSNGNKKATKKLLINR
ncbi:MAG: T9SS type A sorting domain-containing protein, partial [Bacteroidales bacterium]|nr:T9SS type A sorting domain-containing protein [Bacteroidales bacterium]